MMASAEVLVLVLLARRMIRIKLRFAMSWYGGVLRWDRVAYLIIFVIAIRAYEQRTLFV